MARCAVRHRCHSPDLPEALNRTGLHAKWLRFCEVTTPTRVERRRGVGGGGGGGVQEETVALRVCLCWQRLGRGMRPAMAMLPFSPLSVAAGCPG